MKSSAGGATTAAADARRRQIAGAAARLFGQKGYHETAMDDIADAVGLSKPTLYHYVRSKGEIVYLIHDELIDTLTDKLEARIRAGAPPAETLRLVMVDVFGIMDSHPGHFKVYFERHREIPVEYQTGARKKRDHYFDLVRSVIEAGVDSGEFASDNSTLTTLAMFGMMNWSYQWYRPNSTLAPEQIAEHFWKTFHRGLKSP